MKLKPLLPYLLIIICLAAAYSNCLNNEFLWDDEFLIQKNTYLRSWDNLPKMLVSNSTAGFGGKDNFYRPTQNIYYLVIYQLFGLNKAAFHLGNILLHGLNAIFIFLLISKIFRRRDWALLSSLLWVVHPTHTEAVTYMSATADPMSTLFGILCLYTYPYFKKSYGALSLSFIFYGLALMSKESMVVTPPLLMLLIFWTRESRPWNLKSYWPTLPHWALTALYMLARKTWLNFADTYQFYKSSNIYTENIIFRIYTYLATLPEYAEILLAPLDLHMERKFSVFTSFTNGPVLFGLAILLALLGLATWLYLRKKSNLGFFSLAWYFIAFVPMMGILIPVNSFILEHWLYLPSIGLFLLAGAGIAQTRYWHRFLPHGITFALVIVFSLLTIQRNQVWATPISFYSNILQHSAGSARVHNNIAMAFADKKDFRKAAEHYLKAISISDSYPQTRYNLARIYAQSGNLNEALVHLNRSLEIDSSFVYAQELKAQILKIKTLQKPNN